MNDALITGNSAIGGGSVTFTTRASDRDRVLGDTKQAKENSNTTFDDNFIDMKMKDTRDEVQNKSRFRLLSYLTHTCR